MEEAAKILKLKAARYETLLGIKLLPRRRYVPRTQRYFPTPQMYDFYAAYENRNHQCEVDRSRTYPGSQEKPDFFFNGLSADGFDYVVKSSGCRTGRPVHLYLKVKYDLDPRRTRKKVGPS